MNRRQLEVQKAHAQDETEMIRQLKKVYEQAKRDCEAKIRMLSARTDMENLQSIVWQAQYQEALKSQLDGILDILNAGSFTTIADYLTASYENGFFGTLYDLQGQGIPLIFPINQEEAVKALQIDTKLSQGYYRRIGEDTSHLKESIRTELSRGVAKGESWNRMAVQIAKGMNSPFNKAYNNALRIARTEGHRVQQEAAYHCQQRAKSKGADVVKQWDSTLDGLTRPHHVELDGQVRELDAPFEVAGYKAMYPGGFGVASEDIHCRCLLLQRARWALTEEEYYTKWDGDKNELVRVKAKTYNEFKQEAHVLGRSLDYRIVNHTKGDYAIKERVVFLEAMTDMPQKVRDALNSTTVSIGSFGSAYDPETDTVFIGKNAVKREVIHEIGHAIEGKLFDRETIDFLKQQCVQGLSIQNIEKVTACDSAGSETRIMVLKSEKFLDAYQGRIYADSLLEALNPDGSINIDTLKEFVSAAVENYYMNPERMRKKNRKMYDLVDGVLGDEQ